MGLYSNMSDIFSLKQRRTFAYIGINENGIGGNIIGSLDVDQSTASYLEHFNSLTKSNSLRILQEIEWV